HRHQDNPFHQVTHPRASAIINQRIPIIEGHNTHIISFQPQVQLLDHNLHPPEHLGRILSFPHDHDPFHYIVLIIKPYLPNSRHAGKTHFTNVLDHDRSSVIMIDHRILQILYCLQ